MSKEEEQVLSALPCEELSEGRETVLEWLTLDSEGELKLSYICVDGKESGEYTEEINLEESSRLFWEDNE